MRLYISSLPWLALSALMFTSCSSTYWKSEKVFRSDKLNLYLEHQISEGDVMDEGYTHPYTFHEYELTEIFKGLSYQEPRVFKDPVEQSVFSPDEAVRLAEEVSKVLGSARSYQRIRFNSVNFGGGMLFSHQRKTEGVIFLEPVHELNIAFVVVNEDPPPDPVGGNVQEDEYLETTKMNPLSITHSQTPLVPKEWYALKPAEKEGTIHPLWAVVDLDKVRVLYQDKLRSGMAEPAEEAVEPAPGVKDTDDLKQKLQRLKDYHDEGLIDEEEYKEKKRQLLEKVTG